MDEQDDPSTATLNADAPEVNPPTKKQSTPRDESIPDREKLLKSVSELSKGSNTSSSVENESGNSFEPEGTSE